MYIKYRGYEDILYLYIDRKYIKYTEMLYIDCAHFSSKAPPSLPTLKEQQVFLSYITATSNQPGGRMALGDESLPDFEATQLQWQCGELVLPVVLHMSPS